MTGTRLTPKMERFIELDKHKAEVKQFFEDYNEALSEVVGEIGLGRYFQDGEGTVYKTTKPNGTFVAFHDFGIDRTRRNGETKGTLSIKEAKEAGFEIPENEKAKAVGGAE